MTVTVQPSTFEYVDYDADAIARLVEDLQSSIDLAGDVVVEIDETTALGRSRLESIDPIHIWLESGALEDPKRIRQFDPAGAADVLGRHLLRAKDRLDPDFGDPGPDQDLSQAHQTAWEIHAVGRLSRAGHPVNRQRWLYTFRNRHGFTDAADDAFEELWRSSRLTWPQIVQSSDDAAATNPGRLDRKPA